MTARLGNDAVDRGKSQSRAFAQRLGGKERLEHLRQDFGRNAGAGIADLDQGRPLSRRFRPAIVLGLFLRHAGGTDIDLAAALGAHGVTRIDDQVHHDHFHLPLVDMDIGQVTAIGGL